jgi:FkbM family methyltransferase
MSAFRWRIRSGLTRARVFVDDYRLRQLRRRMFAQPARTTKIEQVLDFTMRITDGPNFYMQYKDAFIRRIYDFQSTRPDPLIVDGGANIGMSVLYFKHRYPASRILAFEPDPDIFGILTENVRKNALAGVSLVHAALADQVGPVPFVPDGSAGGRVTESSPMNVQSARLSEYLDQPVDFLKLNIEGAELPVLRDAERSGRLHNVRELVMEYHGDASGEQRLALILELLDRNGFRYLLHDFDAETCGASKPPFRIAPNTRWHCLVYATRALAS